METKELLKKWKGNKRYTLKFIALVRVEGLVFKPIESTKTYQSQLTHITTWLRTHSRFVTGKTFDRPKTKTKEELVYALEEFFDVLLSFLENTTPEELSEIVEMWYGKVSKASVLMTMDNHLAHHRGQLVVYLRMMGQKPPTYIGW